MRGTTFDGEARGANVSLSQVAEVLSSDLAVPVSDKTGLTGSYDFRVEPFAPENEDAIYAAKGAMHRLGLELTKTSGPISTIAVDDVQRPSPN